MRRVAALLALALGPVLVLGVLFVFPVTGMVAQGFWVDGRFAPGEVLDVLARPRVHRIAWFTVWSSGVATLVAVLLGLPVAHALHRLRLPGRSILRAAVLVPFVLPTVVVGVAFRTLLGEGGPLGFLGLDGTPIAIVCGLVFFNIAVVVRAVGSAWESLDPRPGEAAAALGATPVQVLRTVTLPALRPAIVGAASVVFLFCATAFGIVLTLGGVRYGTIETEIYLLTTTVFDLRAAAALSVLQIVVVVGLLALSARLRQVPDPTVQRVVARPRAVRRSDGPVLAATAFVLVAVALPILALVAGSFEVGEGWGLGNYRALTSYGDNQALLVGLLVAAIVTRRSHGVAERRVRSVLDGFFMLPLGVSAVTLGFGFLITLDRPPLDLRDSPLLVPMAQALVALPLVVRTLIPVLAGIDDRQRQAAASLGASPARTLLTVDLPVVWKPMLAAGGFAFAVSLGEFGATSFLARDDNPTLPVVIYRLIGHPGEMNYGMALAASVVLAATTACVMLAVERLRVPSLGAL